MSKIVIEISPGELVDRTTILRLKSERLADSLKLAVVRSELRRHEELVSALTPDAALQLLIDRLLGINARLWEIEDDIRVCERARDFGPRFVELARSIYRENDERSATKREIDKLLGSSITEVKSYAGGG